MIIKAITLPTPKRVLKKIKNIKKEDMFMYGLIAGGIGIISLSDGECKGISISGLLYSAVAYSYINNLDEDILNEISKIYIRQANMI